MNALAKWLNKLASRNERSTARRKLPLVAHYWDGGAPMAHEVRDISPRGLYLLTDQRWYPGTVVTLALQREDLFESHPDRSLTVNARVVRYGTDGVGFSFVAPEHANQNSGLNPLGADKKAVERFLDQLYDDVGQALVEYALVLPLVLLLIVNVVNFGGFFFAWIGVSNAARAGADYAVLDGSSVGFLPIASGSQISALITQDLASLPNNQSVTVNICQNINGTITALSGSCSSIPSDPEPGSYVLITVDVTYTYVPYISAGFSFPNLNVYATIPPTTIHRRAVMRRV